MIIARRRFLIGAGAVLAAPALIITHPSLVEAGWQSQDSNYNKSVAGGGSLGLQTNLTGFWSLENTSWLDDTGNGSTLTAGGSTTTAPGKVGNAASFAGTTDYLSCASNSNLVTGNGAISVSAWVRPTSSAPEYTVVSKDNNAFGQREWILGSRFTCSHVWTWRVWDTGTSPVTCDSTVTVTTAAWHHIVLTCAGPSGAMKIYVDGSNATSGSPTAGGSLQSTASAPFNIGRGNGAIITAGLVDQVGLWKGRVLSASDVTALYNSGNGLSYAAMA